MQNKPHISIGIPIFNGENFFEYTYNCLNNQTYKDFEIIVSNNCSTDNTAKLIDNLKQSNKKMKVYHQPNPLSPVENFKKVLELSQGSYFMWLSHDDYIEKDYLMKIKSLLNEKDAIFGKVKYVDTNQKIINKLQNEQLFNFFGSEILKKIKFIFYPSLSGKMILFWSLYHTDTLKENLHFLKNYPGDFNYFDMPFVFQLLNVFNFKSCKNAVFYKRNHLQSESVKQNKNTNDIFKILKHLFTIKSYLLFLSQLSQKHKIITLALSPLGYFFNLLGNIYIYAIYKEK